MILKRNFRQSEDFIIRENQEKYARATVRNASSIRKASFAETSIAASREFSFANADASSEDTFLSNSKSDLLPSKRWLITNFNFYQNALKYS